MRKSVDGGDKHLGDGKRRESGNKNNNGSSGSGSSGSSESSESSSGESPVPFPNSFDMIRKKHSEQSARSSRNLSAQGVDVLEELDNTSDTGAGEHTPATPSRTSPPSSPVRSEQEEEVSIRVYDVGGGGERRSDDGGSSGNRGRDNGQASNRNGSWTRYHTADASGAERGYPSSLDVLRDGEMETQSGPPTPSGRRSVVR